MNYIGVDSKCMSFYGEVSYCMDFICSINIIVWVLFVLLVIYVLYL